MKTMEYPLIKPIYNVFDDEWSHIFDDYHLDELKTYLNDMYSDITPRKYLIFKQEIDVYLMMNTIVIEFPKGMDIPKDLQDFFMSDNFYYKVFFQFLHDKAYIYIKNAKKGTIPKWLKN